MKWYLERHEEKENAHRYYRITVNATVLLCEWGRYGAAPRSKAETFDSEGKAIEMAEKMRERKIKRGYVEKTEPEQLSFFD